MKLNRKFRLIPIDEDEARLTNLESDISTLMLDKKIPDYKKMAVFESLVKQLQTLKRLMKDAPVVRLMKEPSERASQAIAEPSLQSVLSPTGMTPTTRSGSMIDQSMFESGDYHLPADQTTFESVPELDLETRDINAQEKAETVLDLRTPDENLVLKTPQRPQKRKPLRDIDDLTPVVSRAKKNRRKLFGSGKRLYIRRWA